MPSVPLFLVEKAAGMAIADAVPGLAARALDAREASAACRLYRRIAICQLLQSGLPDRFFEHLALGAQAFLHWLEGVPEDQKLGSLSDPFFDAVACGADDLAAGIARAAPAAFRQGEEYEEELLFPRFLMSHFALRAPVPEATALLERFEAVSDGRDPRAALCRALLDRDQAGFDDAVEAVVRQWSKEQREWLASGVLSPDDRATTAKVSVELLALLRFAEAAGLTTPAEHPLAPSVARRLDRARLPPAGAWQHLPSYQQLG